MSLKNLTHYLYKHHNKKVIILIDEYDTPIQQGYLKGYYEQIIEFMRNLLSGGMKDNSSLEKGILTGILRVAKESIFSGLNNFEVFSIIKNEFNTYFGFLEVEVHQLLKYYNVEREITEVQAWYNGYIFGENIVYNPWSILKFTKNHQYGLQPHWLNTSSNALVRELVIAGGKYFKSDIERLIKGESIEKKIDENVVFSDLDQNPEAVWSLLLLSGYLKVTEKANKNGRLWVTLQVPNKEVLIFYEETIVEWFKNSTRGEMLKEMLEGLLSGDLDTFRHHFKTFVQETMSYFDPTGREPERVYQAFVMGLLVSLKDEYHIKSNRESGLGRYDLALIPKENTSSLGFIFEFKKTNPATKETIQEALQIAQEQIKLKNYQAELLEVGLKKENIIKIAIAFQGKDLLMNWQT